MQCGGCVGLAGAILLQSAHRSRSSAMCVVMPGQKTDIFALAVMDVVPWWAECRAASTSFRREGGITTLSL